MSKTRGAKLSEQWVGAIRIKHRSVVGKCHQKNHQRPILFVTKTHILAKQIHKYIYKYTITNTQIHKYQKNYQLALPLFTKTQPPLSLLVLVSHKLLVGNH